MYHHQKLFHLEPKRGTMFIGHTRYSLFVPRSTAWRASNGARLKSSEEYREYLYNQDRLKAREQIFIDMSLPIISAAAERHSIAHVVSYSDSLPEENKQNLYEAADKYSFLILDEQPEGLAGTSIDGIATSRLGGEGVYGRYRLDDDDVLSADYFDRMAGFLRPEYAGMVVSFPLGVIAGIDRDGRVFNLREIHTPMVAIGLLYICQIDGRGSFVAPRSGTHVYADRYNPVILDSRDYGYFRFTHSDQDSAIGDLSAAGFATMIEQLNIFKQVPAERNIKQLYPTVSKYISESAEIDLVRQDTSIESSYSAQFEAPMSCFSVSGEFTFGPSVRPKDYVLSFEVINKEGKLQTIEDDVPGLSKSTNRAIGFYRYVSISSLRGSVDEFIMLPTGLSVKGITLMHRKGDRANFVIHSLKYKSMFNG